MNPPTAAVRLNKLLSTNLDLPPEPWRVLIARVLKEANAALVRNDRFHVRDQAVLELAHRLTRAGAHASWVMAQAPSHGRQRVGWQAVASWHHAAHVAIHAGWERRPLLGTNRALPLEANRTPQTPPPVQVTDLAQTWINRLLGDPLLLSVDAATLGLSAIPGGVWIAP